MPLFTSENGLDKLVGRTASQWDNILQSNMDWQLCLEVSSQNMEMNGFAFHMRHPQTGRPGLPKG